MALYGLHPPIWIQNVGVPRFVSASRRRRDIRAQEVHSSNWCWPLVIERLPSLSILVDQSLSVSLPRRASHQTKHACRHRPRLTKHIIFYLLMSSGGSTAAEASRSYQKTMTQAIWVLVLFFATFSLASSCGHPGCRRSQPFMKVTNLPQRIENCDLNKRKRVPQSWPHPAHRPVASLS